MEAQEESCFLFWGPLSCFFSCCPCFYSFDCRVWMLLFYWKTNVLWLPAFTLLKYLSMHFWKFVLARIWHFNQRAVYALRFSLATKILLSLLLLIKICMMMIVLARLSCCRWWRICFMINLNLKFHYKPSAEKVLGFIFEFVKLRFVTVYHENPWRRIINHEQSES